MPHTAADARLLPSTHQANMPNLTNDSKAANLQGTSSRSDCGLGGSRVAGAAIRPQLPDSQACNQGYSGCGSSPTKHLGLCDIIHDRINFRNSRGFFGAIANLESFTPAQANLDSTPVSQPNDTLLHLSGPNHDTNFRSCSSNTLLNCFYNTPPPAGTGLGSSYPSTQQSGPAAFAFEDNYSSRKSMVAELAALQSRSAALQRALSGTSLATSNDFTLATNLVADNCYSGELDRMCTWDTDSIPCNALDLARHGPSSSKSDVVGTKCHLSDPKSSYQNRDSSNDVFTDPLFDQDFQDFFDFSMASFPSIHNPDSAIPTLNPTNFAEPENKTSNVESSPNTPQIQPVTTAATAATANAQRRHHCQHCMMTFRRPSDRDRHALSHNPNAPRFACPFPGCARVGRRGFLRRDKLTQHQVHMNH
ncbi:uncharacterized protein PAC_15701 [Phialocephala subalpina]|uniref:C2H2-type domain-containing protein n=1 Tax=Phialocephala subalpina TaxID=576137 RepID=A0A1L7XL61_9HELO|nr:uncharacterized protein PAC_15701 [Phialocephala subalpina]